MEHMHTNRSPVILPINGLSDTIKLFSSSSLYEQHDKDTYQRSLNSVKIISIDKAFVTMKSMILLPRTYLTQS
ncbi:hypothetical protein ACE6H2_023081 [Prunus campanulata]